MKQFILLSDFPPHTLWYCRAEIKARERQTQKLFYCYILQSPVTDSLCKTANSWPAWARLTSHFLPCKLFNNSSQTRSLETDWQLSSLVFIEPYQWKSLYTIPKYSVYQRIKMYRAVWSISRTEYDWRNAFKRMYKLFCYFQKKGNTRKRTWIINI